MSLGLDMDVERMREQGDVAGLIRTLDHPNATVRYQAVDALGTLRDPVSGERLAQTLQDPDCGVRWKAAEALGKIGSGAIPFLCQALRDPAADIRWRAALALGETRGKAAIPALIEALSDADPYVRGRAIVALSGFRAGAIPALRKAATEGGADMQAGAVRAFGLMEDTGLPELRQLVDGPVDDSMLLPLEEAFLDQGLRSLRVVEDLLTESGDPALRALAWSGSGGSRGGGGSRIRPSPAYRS
jgi:FOG: HEAT repeat